MYTHTLWVESGVSEKDMPGVESGVPERHMYALCARYVRALSAAWAGPGRRCYIFRIIDLRKILSY